MGALLEIGNLLQQTFFSLLLTAVLLRLLLQLARADFYNPISQFLVKATNPLVLPLRRVIPAIGQVDTASVVLALIVQMLAITVTALLYRMGMPPVIPLLLWSVLGCIAFVLNIYFFAVLASIILSWVAGGSYHPAVILLHQLTEPVMKPFRSLLPAMGGLDFSPILLFLAINVLQILLRHFAQQVGLHPALVFGI